MSKRTAIPLGVCLLLGLAVSAVLLTRPVSEVRVALPDREGQIADSVWAQPQELLCMRYIHSVERTPVEGRFAIAEEGGFRAVETRTAGAGTGLPNVAKGRKVSIEGERLVVDEGRRYYPEIPFYYHPLNKLRIRVDGTRLDLGKVPQGSRLRITSRTHPFWRWLLTGRIPL